MGFAYRWQLLNTLLKEKDIAPQRPYKPEFGS
jgi:hypothetical protein